MKRCLKLGVILLSTGLYFQPSILLAQENNKLSQKASDIQETAPATVSEQESGGTYSQPNLCQIGKKLSKTTKSKGQTNSGPDAVVFDSPDRRKINKGIPLSKVLGSLAKEGNEKQSRAIKTEPSSNDCE